MDCNLNGIPDECENAPITLELGNDIVEVARTPRVLKTADVNRDDVPDVVQISHFRGNSHLTVLLGTGGQSLVSIAEYSLEGLAYSVVAGDFDGDEKLDLVTVNGLTYLFLKGRGDGTFEDPVSYDHTIESRTVDALDVDGNGSLDLIFGDRAAGTLSLRLGDGTGRTPSATMDFSNFHGFSQLLVFWAFVPGRRAADLRRPLRGLSQL